MITKVFPLTYFSAEVMTSFGYHVEPQKNRTGCGNTVKQASESGVKI